MDASGTAAAAPRIRPEGLVYALDERPPALRLLLLGLQYAVMDAIYLVLVAIILRAAHVDAATSVNLMGIACIAVAIGTALQALPRGPVGSGFLAPPVFSATYLAPSVLAAQAGGMPLVFGMTLLAGLAEIAFGLLLGRLRVIVTPVLSGLSVFIVGLQLGVVGIGQMLDARHEHLATYGLHLSAAVATLAVCVGLSIWGRGAAKLLCSSMGLAVGMALAAAVGMMPPGSLAGLHGAAWFAVPMPAIGHIRFDLHLMPAFLASGVAAALRAVGVVTTCQRINDAGWRRPDMGNIRRGVLADGLANTLGGILGAPGMNIAPSLVGISTVTGATSRVIAFAAAAILFVIGLSPRIAGALLLVPPEVAGPLLVFTSSFMISGGMQIMLARPLDPRGVYVISISTLLALSESVFPAYYRALRPMARSLTENPLAFGLGTAVLLTLLFRLGTRHKAETPWDGSEPSTRRAVGFLETTGKAWKVPAETLSQAAAQMARMMAMQPPGMPADGRLRLSFDGADLDLALRWGRPEAPVPLPAAQPVPPATLEIENEESALMLGLRDFLRGLTADRKSVTRRRGEVLVRLGYSV
ncbi:solute carrier family 23 protein [Acidisphaera rubrifaciens]|uniref:Xanthine/uracil/vitamin C transporter n=1 Tax=Acidisphaera rubrifaciens HS-AP3 TaxID=1231350 RepID=A0A0D6P790_9PROT|nr:solute carrier family 23 protein [Acidisphaera rubrifaciens]GAN77610.1 xanthine/uracil/vitamin C transporter [Acidisphaera rubrifaciens HS-AP3]